jgi:NAD(P)H-nitrite reductase large subunit
MVRMTGGDDTSETESSSELSALSPQFKSRRERAHRIEAAGATTGGRRCKTWCSVCTPEASVLVSSATATRIAPKLAILNYCFAVAL